MTPGVSRQRFHARVAEANDPAAAANDLVHGRQVAANTGVAVRLMENRPFAVEAAGTHVEANVPGPAGNAHGAELLLAELAVGVRQPEQRLVPLPLPFLLDRADRLGQVRRGAIRERHEAGEAAAEAQCEVADARRDRIALHDVHMRAEVVQIRLVGRPLRRREQHDARRNRSSPTAWPLPSIRATRCGRCYAPSLQARRACAGRRHRATSSSVRVVRRRFGKAWRQSRNPCWR